uniref:Uncharacterized protein n=1 Tax=Oryza barthii TaxID=65489 RepID=A0A0D3HTQ8_9ORYZ
MGFPCSVGPGKNHLLERSGKIPREERRRNEHTDATAGVACGATWRRRQRRRHGSLLRPPPSLRGRPSGRALAPTPTLTTCSSPAPAWAWAWAWVASASAAPCPCPAPAVAWPGHRRVLGCRKGEERRGGGEDCTCTN